MHDRLQRGSKLTRQGFTLLELLIVIAVMVVLGSITSLTLVAVQQQIRVDRTRETIAKLNALIMTKWESYKTRRIALPPATVTVSGVANATFTSTSTNMTREMALARLDYVRELMRMEMPDRFSDIIDDPALPDPAKVTTTVADWATLVTTTAASNRMPRPAVATAYFENLRSHGVTTNGDVKNAFHTNQNAECLYMIVTMGLEGATNRELFSTDEIGDTDNDGFPEFLDGWGRPIRFLRWAPGFLSSSLGFVSAVQSNTDFDSFGYPKDPDPFDPMRVDTRDGTGARTAPTSGTLANPTKNYALYPLIYSAGPDGAYGVVDGIIIAADQVANPPLVRYSQTSPRNDPYVTFASLGIQLGTPKRRIAVTFQGNDFSTPDRPLVNVNDSTATLVGDEPFGDFTDNLHNQTQPFNR